MRAGWIAACLVFAGTLAVVWGTPQGEFQGGTSLLYTATPHYEPLAWLHGGNRFPGGAQLLVFDGKTSRVMVPAFFASSDASVSFDGTRVLFAGKQHASDPWQIWEIAVAGGSPIRLTSCQQDCVLPLYLPEDRIVYAHKVRGIFQIEGMPIKGGEPLVLTRVPGDAIPSDVLRDGRILFQAAFPLGGRATAELYTVYSDGSGVESYRCDHGAARFAGTQISSGDVVFASAGRLARFTSALAQQVDVVAPAGEFAGDVSETSPGTLVGAWRPDSKSAYSIAKWSADGREITQVISKSGADLVQPRALSARAIPHRHPSGLHDWDGANVLCLNAYTSKSSTIAEGSITGVRLYTQNARGQTVLLGTSNVEKDGSFFVHVPADQPLKFELVDRAGKVLERERGWYWMRRGEQRVCVGCHTGPERAPENVVPAVLVKSTEPVDLTRSHSGPHSGGH